MVTLNNRENNFFSDLSVSDLISKIIELEDENEELQEKVDELEEKLKEE
jgi:hypothetical protein